MWLKHHLKDPWEVYTGLADNSSDRANAAGWIKWTTVSFITSEKEGQPRPFKLHVIPNVSLYTSYNLVVSLSTTFTCISQTNFFVPERSLLFTMGHSINNNSNSRSESVYRMDDRNWTQSWCWWIMNWMSWLEFVGHCDLTSVHFSWRQ